MTIDATHLPDDGHAGPPWGILAAVLAVAAAWNVIGNLWLPSPLYVPANLAVGVAVVAIARRTPATWDQLGLAPRDLGRGVLFGLVAVLAVAIVFAIGVAVTGSREWFLDDNVSADSGFERWFVPLVRIPLGTALYEELVFRSAIIGVLLAFLRPRWALVWSSILFGAWHIVPAWETGDSIVGVVAVTTLGGAAFGVLRLWSRSVLAAVLAHTATNSLAYVAAVVALELD